MKTTTWRWWLAAILAMAPAASVWAQAAAAPSDDVNTYVKAIQSAPTANAAVEAYGKGCVIDRTNTALNKAQLKRMLELGRPDLALYPAQTLSLIDPTNALVWGLLGYDAAKRADQVKALSAWLKAGADMSDDASLLLDLGQMLAWYDSQPKAPDLSALDRKTLDRLRPTLAGKSNYSKPYDAVRMEYKATEDAKKLAADKIASLKDEIKNLDAQKATLEGQFKTLNDKADANRRNINRIRGDLTNANLTFMEKDRLQREQAREDKTLSDLNAQMDKLKQQASPIAADSARKQKAMDDAMRSVPPDPTAIYKKLQWKIPGGYQAVAVDTPPTTSSGPAKPVSADAETKAADMLKRASVYLDNGMNDKGQEILRDLLISYPDTKAATEAKTLLK